MKRQKKQESSTARRARRDARRAAAEASVLARALDEDSKALLKAFIGLQKEVGMKLGEAIERHKMTNGILSIHIKKDLQAAAILKGALELGIIQRKKPE